MLKYDTIECFYSCVSSGISGVSFSLDYLICQRVSPAFQAGDRRYLLCPVEVSIGHLKKFIRLKFSLPQHYQVPYTHTHTHMHYR